MASKKVLVLGAGLVAGPLVRYLLENGYTVHVGSRTVSKADNLVAGFERGTSSRITVEDSARLQKAVSEADLVVSLLPATQHVIIAELCLQYNKHLVTTSYVSGAMKALDRHAREKGLLLLNETGLDPGIDHMSAMKVIDQVKADGGTITSFRSCCGGLPAPANNDNAFGYKFSWSPRGVLLAARNPARYLRNNTIVEVSSEDLFLDCDYRVIEGVGLLEIYPNRDSLGYTQIYGIETAATMFRGTFRNLTHCRTWKQIVDLGLLDTEKQFDLSGKTSLEFIAEFLDTPQEKVRKTIGQRLGIQQNDLFFIKMEWLGLFSNIALPEQTWPTLDVLAWLMLEKMQYAEGERDLVVLYHEFEAAYPDGSTEFITSTLVDYGIPDGDSSMARTVALPAAIAARMILESAITVTGVQIPISPGIYTPILKELADQNIVCQEKFSGRTPRTR